MVLPTGLYPTGPDIDRLMADNAAFLAGAVCGLHVVGTRACKDSHQKNWIEQGDKGQLFDWMERHLKAVFFQKDNL